MTDERTIAYLLRELPEDDAEQFEDECFAQASWPEHIEHAEDDLIDAYLRGELTTERRRRFEQNYLTTPTRQERVAIAAALFRLVEEHGAPTAAEPIVQQTSQPGLNERPRVFLGGWTWSLRAATAAVGLGLIAGALWLLVLRPSPPRTFATLTLTLTRDTRGGGGSQFAVIKLPGNIDALRVSLILPEETSSAARYRVELRNVEEETLPVSLSRPDSKLLLAEVPASKLSRGSYYFTLIAILPNGTEQPIPGSYKFIVE